MYRQKHWNRQTRYIWTIVALIYAFLKELEMSWSMTSVDNGKQREITWRILVLKKNFGGGKKRFFIDLKITDEAKMTCQSKKFGRSTKAFFGDTESNSIVAHS